MFLKCSELSEGGTGFGRGGCLWGALSQKRPVLELGTLFTIHWLKLVEPVYALVESIMD